MSIYKGVNNRIKVVDLNKISNLYLQIIEFFNKNQMFNYYLTKTNFKADI